MFYRGINNSWYCQICMDEGFGPMDIIDRDIDQYGDHECVECGMSYDHAKDAYTDINGYEYDDAGEIQGPS